MTTPKTNTSNLEKQDKNAESLQNISENVTFSNRQSLPDKAKEVRTSHKVNSGKKKGEENFLNLYETNFHSGNLDYIKLLLQNKTSSNKEKAKEVVKKKGHIRAKSNISEDVQSKAVDNNQESVSSKSTRQIIAPVNEDIPNKSKFSLTKLNESHEKHSGQFHSNGAPGHYAKEDYYEGNDTHRNLDLNDPIEKEGKLFEKYFKNDGVVRRSMSLEDLRLDKKGFGGNHNKSTMHHPEDMGSEIADKSPDRSIYNEFKQSHLSPEGGFLSSLKLYIDYFKKSENGSYINMKAGQYFRGNTGKSHRSMQRDLDVVTQELNVTKLQMQKVKWTLNKVLEENKILTKEMKSVHIKEREQEQLFHQMQGMQEEIISLRQKNHKYKAKCMEYHERFRQERIDNENNLRSLKQVLANINVALDHKSSPHKKEKKAQLKNLLGENLFSKKDRENIEHHYKKDKRRLNGTVDAHGSTYETGNHRGSIGNKESSMLLSPKMASFSSNEEQEGEEYLQQFSNSNEIENVYDGESYQIQGAHHQPNLSKKQQIKFLKEKLNELMNNEDVSFSGHTTCAKTSTKTSRGQQPKYKKNISEMEAPSYYLSKDRQGLYKHPNIGAKNSPKEQRSRVVHQNYQFPPSFNDATEGSFSST